MVNIKYSGVCHTDLHAVNGDWPLARKLPLVGGHEGAGVVVARGELVKDIEIGDHAGVKVNIPLTAFPTCGSALTPFTVAQQLLPLLRLLPNSRRTSLPQSRPLGLHRRRHLPAILHRQSCPRCPHPQGCPTRRHCTSPLRRYYCLQRAEGVRCQARPDGRHRRCRRRTRVIGLPVRQGHGS